MVALTKDKLEGLTKLLRKNIETLDAAADKLRHDENCDSHEGKPCNCSVKELRDRVLEVSIENDEYIASVTGVG